MADRLSNDLSYAPLFLVVAAGFGLAFWLSIPWHPYPFSVLVKSGVLATLMVFAWFHRAQAGRLLPLTLVAHGAGDVFLDLDRVRFFLPAMGAFFLGHLGYAWLFWPARRPWSQLSAMSWLGLIVVLGLGVSIGILVLPNLKGPLRVAVPVYIVAIMTMAVLAIRGQWASPLIALGALSYVVSDSLIAVNTFVQSLSWARWVIWPTYVAAQMLIVFALVKRAQTSPTRSLPHVTGA